MSEDYTPDRWMILKIVPIKELLPPHYRVFATWAGGFAQGDSWKMNSGIISVTEDETYFYFQGASGATYACLKKSYGVSAYGTGILANLIEKSQEEVSISSMPKDTDWPALQY